MKYKIETKDLGYGWIELPDYFEHGDIINPPNEPIRYITFDPWRNRLMRSIFGGFPKKLNIIP